MECVVPLSYLCFAARGPLSLARGGFWEVRKGMCDFLYYVEDISKHLKQLDYDHVAKLGDCRFRKSGLWTLFLTELRELSFCDLAFLEKGD